MQPPHDIAGRCFPRAIDRATPTSTSRRSPEALARARWRSASSRSSSAVNPDIRLNTLSRPFNVGGAPEPCCRSASGRLAAARSGGPVARSAGVNGGDHGGGGGRPAPGDRGGSHEVVPLDDPLHAAKVLGRPLDLRAFSLQHEDLHAGVSPQMEVRGGLDVLPPAVLCGGKPPEDIRGGVAVEDHHGTHRVRFRIAELVLGEFLADQESDGIGPARGVAVPDPAVEGDQ